MRGGKPDTARRLRIIGGRWRGRRLGFPDIPGLRPTPDRVRETLFNWLAPVIEGTRCLDLFAGSGALGLEALSRGASEVVFVDRDHRAVRTLRENLDVLGGPGDGRSAGIHQAEALDWLADSPPVPFDIVFLDPPFGQDLLAPVCFALQRPGWLRPDTRVYVESAADPEPPLPPDWTRLRQTRAGRVAARLLVAAGRTQ